MAHHKSALKRIRQTAIRTERNRAGRTRVKTVTRQFRESLEQGTANSQELLIAAIKTISKAASKGFIPKQRASRKISRLTKQLNAAAK